MDALTQFFASNGFMPHGYCFQWTSSLLWTYVFSDGLIAAAYYSIPVALWTFVRRRPDLPFSWVFILFAVFILACGTTHLMGIWNIWRPVYWLDAGLKAATATVSIVTAMLLWPLLPKALALPSPRQLEAINRRLLQEVAERRRLEQELQALNHRLEQRVAERTSELAAANAELRRTDDEREQAGRLLLESRQLLESVVDNAATVIYVKRLDGRYLLVNRRYQALFHVTQPDMLDRTDYDIFESDHADAFRRVDQQVALTGEVVQTEEVAPLEDGEHTYLSIKFPVRDAQGHIYAVGGISTDITERKRAQERLQAQLERLNLLDQITCAIGERQDMKSIYQVVVQRLADRLPADLCCICDHDAAAGTLRVQCVSAGEAVPAAAHSLGEQTLIDIDGNGLARCVAGQLVHESDLALLAFPFPRRLAGAGLRALVMVPLQSAGGVFGVLVVARRLADRFASPDCEFLRQLCAHVALAAQQAQLVGALQQAYDDLRQSEQAVLQRERLRALGEMASGIAHDINNAISPVALYAESLLEHESGLSPRARDCIENIARAIDDVAATVARMREFYRPREPQLAFTTVPLNRLVRQVVDHTRARWSDMPQQRGVVIRTSTELADDLPDVMGVESELREALINLIFNAVDAMPEGGRLSLRTRSIEAADAADGASLPRVLVEVSDTGVGMDEHTRRHCLDPFFTTKGERGTGLGLAMVYGVTQRHGAEIRIDSAPGLGTTVGLIFARADPTLPLAPAVAAAPAALPCLRILLVDDDPLVLKALRETLSAYGHDVQAADGGQAGVDAVQAARASGQAFDAVITDLGMPYVDGRQVARAVKQAFAATPVLMLTGWGQRLLDDDEVPAHVDAVLNKPPKVSEVRAALARLCGPRAAAEATAEPGAAQAPPG